MFRRAPVTFFERPFFALAQERSFEQEQPERGPARGGPGAHATRGSTWLLGSRRVRGRSTRSGSALPHPLKNPLSLVRRLVPPKSRSPQKTPPDRGHFPIGRGETNAGLQRGAGPHRRSIPRPDSLSAHGRGADVRRKKDSSPNPPSDHDRRPMRGARRRRLPPFTRSTP